MKVKVRKRHNLNNVIRKHGWWVSKYGTIRFGDSEEDPQSEKVPF